MKHKARMCSTEPSARASVRVRFTGPDDIWRPTVRFGLTVLLLVFVSIPTNHVVAQEQRPPDYNCELATVFIVDKSGSMDADADGRSKLRRVRDALTNIVQQIPSGYWNVGLGTFEESGVLKWGMDVLTDGNRAGLANVIGGLTAGGGSPILAGLHLGAFSLMTDTVHPRILVIFSDGQVCGGDFGPPCDEVVIAAATARTEGGIAIITVGYNLSGDDADVMRDMASTVGGTRLFFNSTSGNALTETLIRLAGELCYLREATLRVTPVSLELAPGGVGTLSYSVTWSFGDPFSARLRSDQTNAINPRFLGPIEASLGPSSPAYGGKIEIEVPTGTTPGDHTEAVTVYRIGANLDTRTIQLRVLRCSFSVEIETLSPPLPWRPSARVRLRTTSDCERQMVASVSYQVTNPGQTTDVPGFEFGSGGGFTIPMGFARTWRDFVFTRTSLIATSAQYDLHVIIHLAGISRRVVVPNVLFRW